MRTGKGQKGRFDVREGMAFVMDDMEELSPEGTKRGAGGHPWLITMVDDDVIKVVMCKTLINNDSDKHRMHQLDFDNVTDICDGCPPLDGSRKMTNAVCLDTVFTLPKKELFTHRLRLLNENTLDRNFSTEGHSALCMSEKELNIVRSEINEYIGRHYDPDMQDPFGFEAAEDNLYRLQSGEPVPDGFTNESFTRAFGWKHLPKADPNAVYPAESKMHPYEKRDVKIVKIVALRDSRYSDCKRIMREKAEDIKLDLNDIADIPSGNRKQTDDMNNVNNKGGTVCTR